MKWSIHCLAIVYVNALQCVNQVAASHFDANESCAFDPIDVIVVKFFTKNFTDGSARVVVIL
jgi:hypothetical protein